MLLRQALFLDSARCSVRRMPHMQTYWKQVFAAMYSQSLGSTMSEARYRIYSKKNGKLSCIIVLPPTEANLYLHVHKAHLQMILWKSSDQEGSPNWISYSLVGRWREFFRHRALTLVFLFLRASLMSSTLDTMQRGRHAALRVVAATKITCHALSAVYVQQPMGFATHIP